MAFTCGGIVAHVSSSSATSKSVSVTVKIDEDNKEIKQKSIIFAGSEHPKPLITVYQYDCFKLCVYFYFQETCYNSVTVNHVLLIFRKFVNFNN